VTTRRKGPRRGAGRRSQGARVTARRGAAARARPRKRGAKRVVKGRATSPKKRVVKGRATSRKKRVVKGRARPARATRGTRRTARKARRTARKTRPAITLRALPARRAARSPAAPPFPQTAGASPKNELLFRIVKARASVLASIQGMGAAAAEHPLGEGKWNSRETILHLVTRDRARLREMEAALRGTWPSWDGADDERQARVNEEDLAPLRRLSWEDAVRLLLTTRQQLMEAVESIPDEPSEVWSEAHPLGWMFQRLPTHDLHHADIIKAWRTRQGA